MAKLTVHRKGYKRKSYVKDVKRGKGVKLKRIPAAYVKPATFKITDIGARGRGKKILPKLKRGTLGGAGFFERSRESQLRLARGVASKYGEKVALGKLRALQVFFKRTDPEKSERAKKLAHEIAGEYKGRKRVPYPTGFRRKTLSRVS